MSIERALVIGARGGVGSATASALTAAGAEVLAVGRERDTTDPAQVAALLDEADPDLVVVAVGARPHMASIEEHDWESFSEVWDVDVRIAFEVGRAALARPLRPDSTVVIVSSGAGFHGSPLSGGYAGAKRMQMFLASYLQRAANARELGIRFVALAPKQLLSVRPEDEPALIAERPEMIAALRRAFPGALAAWLCKRDDGTWLEVVLWRSRAEAEEAARRIDEVPEARHWFGLIAESHGLQHLSVAHERFFDQAEPAHANDEA